VWQAMKGQVIWFDVQKGYGFLRADSGAEYFVHYSKILAPSGEFRLLIEGEDVEFEPIEVERGTTKKLQAKDVKRLGGHNETSGKDPGDAIRG